MRSMKPTSHPKRLWGTIKSLLTHPLQASSFHLQSLNPWQIPWHHSSYKRFLPSRIPFPQNCTAALPLLILINPIRTNCFPTSPLSHQQKSLSYSTQCQTNHHHLIMFPRHFWNMCWYFFHHHLTYIWQTYLSNKVLSLPSSKLALVSPLLKKPGLPKSGPCKLQTNFKFKYHRQNLGTPCPCTPSPPHFISPVSVRYNPPTASIILRIYLSSNYQESSRHIPMNQLSWWLK